MPPHWTMLVPRKSINDHARLINFYTSYREPTLNLIPDFKAKSLACAEIIMDNESHKFYYTNLLHGNTVIPVDLILNELHLLADYFHGKTIFTNLFGTHHLVYKILLVLNINNV